MRCMRIDMAETKVATTVQSPATSKIGKGSAEPEPCPSFGSRAIVATEFESESIASHAFSTVAVGGVDVVEVGEEAYLGGLRCATRACDDGSPVVVAEAPRASQLRSGRRLPCVSCDLCRLRGS